MPVPENVRTVEGTLDASGFRFALVVSRFNSFVTERLLEGAIDTLLRSGALPGHITVYRVAGSFEIPSVVARILRVGGPDAVVALGCLIRGDTIHFDLIASEVTKGLARLDQESDVPVTFGVLTANTLEQAIDRAGGKQGNKGSEAAQAAIEHAQLVRAMKEAAKRKA